MYQITPPQKKMKRQLKKIKPYVDWSLTIVSVNCVNSRQLFPVSSSVNIVSKMSYFSRICFSFQCWSYDLLEKMLSGSDTITYVRDSFISILRYLSHITTSIQIPLNSSDKLVIFLYTFLIEL